MTTTTTSSYSKPSDAFMLDAVRLLLAAARKYPTEESAARHGTLTPSPC